MNNKSRLLKGLALAVAIVLATGGYLTALPAGAIKMDVNPSIEIVTNRLDRVIEVSPLNLDAKRMLDGFSPKDKSLEGTVNEIVDLMVLSGYISGGKDNVVRLTVKDDSVDSDLVERVNKAIAAMLENKRIEARIIKQTMKESLDDDYFDNDFDDYSDDDRDDDDRDDDSSAVQERQRPAATEKLKEETKPAINKQSQLIGEERAKAIALELANGRIVSFELDDDDDDDMEYKIEIIGEGKEYEIEIDAYTGIVLEFEIDDLDDDLYYDDDDDDDYDDDDDDDDDNDDDPSENFDDDDDEE